MAKTPKTYRIGDTEYAFYPMSPERSIKMLTRLTKVLGEPLVRVLAGVVTSQGEGEDQSKPATDDRNLLMDSLKRESAREAITEAVSTLASRLDEDQVVDTIKTLISSAEIKRPGDNGTRRINFEADYAGRIGELMMATRYAIEAEYGDFFDVFAQTT